MRQAGSGPDARAAPGRRATASEASFSRWPPRSDQPESRRPHPPTRMQRLFALAHLLDWLLIFAPVALVLEHVVHAGAVAVFATSALAIIPLAGLMGRATEQLAERLGEGVGGLLNATFGNAAELIIAGIALHAGLYDLVKASITGSIIGNVLLVFGLSALIGGARFPSQ